MKTSTFNCCTTQYFTSLVNYKTNIEIIILIIYFLFDNFTIFNSIFFVRIYLKALIISINFNKLHFTVQKKLKKNFTCLTTIDKKVLTVDLSLLGPYYFKLNGLIKIKICADFLNCMQNYISFIILKVLLNIRLTYFH